MSGECFSILYGGDEIWCTGLSLYDRVVLCSLKTLTPVDHRLMLDRLAAFSLQSHIRKARNIFFAFLLFLRGGGAFEHSLISEHSTWRWEYERRFYVVELVRERR
jgi:hypothetical protein